VPFYVSALTLGWVTEMIAGLQKKPVPIIARDSFTEQADWQRTGKFMYLGHSCIKVQTSGVM